MSRSSAFAAGWGARALSLLRIVAAFLFMAHGAQKLFAFPAAGKGGIVPLLTWYGAASVLELFGGFLLLLGLFTRPVALILSGEMAVAYFMNHASGGFWPLLNQGELAVLYCFVFLFLAAAGGGEWSMDRVLRR
ncbi:MAG: putative oxidoreductase [Acidobacteriota bacterium]|jgi:putative oxidoreductase|nr:putative oxidoreductase [Acidobacteriota bacterium]